MREGTGMCGLKAALEMSAQEPGGLEMDLDLDLGRRKGAQIQAYWLFDPEMLLAPVK